MRIASVAAIAACLAFSIGSFAVAHDDDRFDQDSNHHGDHDRGDPSISVGVRPTFLVAGMDDSPLKRKLLSCQNDLVRRTQFSIAHRGAPLQLPEHTKEAYDAGARMGAGIVECDVTFTKDGALVCRHDECDLHTTTNIVDTPLNASCTTPWSGAGSAPKCCTSDITLTQFKSLKGKMDASNP